MLASASVVLVLAVLVKSISYRGRHFVAAVCFCLVAAHLTHAACVETNALLISLPTGWTAQASQDALTITLTYAEVCGDAHQGDTEACDDGNTVPLHTPARVRLVYVAPA